MFKVKWRKVNTSTVKAVIKNKVIDNAKRKEEKKKIKSIKLQLDMPPVFFTEDGNNSDN